MRGIAGRVLLVSFLLFPLTGLSLADQWDEAGEQLCKVTVPGRGNPNSPRAPAAAQQFLNQFPFNAQNAARPNAEVYYAAAYLPQIFPAYSSRDYQQGYQLYTEYLSFFSQNVLAREGRMVEMVGVKCLLGLNPGPEEALAIRVARRLTSEDMLDQLPQLFIQRQIPAYIRSDNGSEFTAKTVRKWLDTLGVKTLYIEPGSPWENGYLESLNGKLRDELLNAEIFDTLREAQVLVAQ